MRFKNAFAVILVLAVGYSPAAKADAVISEGCKAVGAAVGAAIGFGITRGVSRFVETIAAAAGASLGTAPVSVRCENYFENWQKQTNFDYEAFVREVCNGNAYTCPNGWNSMGGLPDSPRDCSTFIVCSFAFAVRSNGSVSVQDIINSAIFVDLSRSSGFWDFNSFGYLVGVPGASGAPGEMLDLR